jgi:pheromone shutdown protein TraB
MKGSRYQQQGLLSYPILLVIFKAGVISALSLKRKSFSSPSCVGVCLPNNNNKRINYYVIGTSHFSCNSYNEVSALINLVQPDACVIELDPERTLRLTLDHASTRIENTNRLFGADFLSAIETSKELDIPIFLGDESPIETRARLLSLFDVDSYKSDKLLSTLVSLFRRSRHPNKDSKNKNKTEDQSEILFVDVLGTFLDDPRKLLPLVTTLSLPVLALALTVIVDGSTASGAAASAASIVTTEVATTIVADTTTNSGFFFEILPTILSLLISFVASCKVYNNLIADRDIVVASNAQRAAETIALLQSNQLIRKRWTFPAYASATNNGTYEEVVVAEEEVNDKSSTPSASATIPLFTLKTPLEKNAVRNLNLFEPRWLKMIDRLPLSKQQQQSINNGEEASAYVCVDAFTDTIDTTRTTTINNNVRIKDNNIVEQQTIGCVTCENKFYSAVNIAEAAEGNEKSLPFVEGRYADVIFRRLGRFGEVINVTEGNRPSGARKVSARIVGGESFELPSSKGNDRDDDRISVVPEGYLTATNLRPIINKDEKIFKTDIVSGLSTNNNSGINNDKDNIGEYDDIETDDDEINIVVVVGLLHANGVLECLSRNHLL